MTTSEYDARRRAINAKVWGVYVGSSVAALIICPLVVWLAGKRIDQQAWVFGIGLVAAALVVGLPLFLALTWESKVNSILLAESLEEGRVENFRLLQRYLNEHDMKEAEGDNEQEHEDRSSDAEQA